MAQDSIFCGCIQPGSCSMAGERSTMLSALSSRPIELGYDKKAVFTGMSVAQAAVRTIPSSYLLRKHFLSTAKKTASTSVRLSTTTSLLKIRQSLPGNQHCNQQDPTNSQFYVVKGIISEYSGDFDAATESYKNFRNPIERRRCHIQLRPFALRKSFTS